MYDSTEEDNPRDDPKELLLEYIIWLHSFRF
jgi:hypothetical protein